MNIFINDSGYLDITDNALKSLAEGWLSGLKCDVGVTTSFTAGFKVALGLLNTHAMLSTKYIDRMPVEDDTILASFPNHGHIYKVSTDGSIPLGFVPEPSDDSDEIRKAMISHITCTEVKENNSTFLIHEPGKAF